MLACFKHIKLLVYTVKRKDIVVRNTRFSPLNALFLLRVSEKLQQQRARERREQYKQVRAHVRKEDGRLQAYGWSLPSKGSPGPKNANTNANVECESQTKPHTSSVPVPVPVFCRPLLEKEPGMKVLFYIFQFLYLLIQ